MDVMNIFKSKAVVGLFDNDNMVNHAVEALQARGFGQVDDEKIKLVDRHRLTQEMPATTDKEFLVAPVTSGSSKTGAVVPTSESVSEGSDIIESSVFEELTGHGIGDEEAHFFARQVVHGGKLVIVEVDDGEAESAFEAMKQVESSRVSHS
jgi:hypothetical protein